MSLCSSPLFCKCGKKSNGFMYTAVTNEITERPGVGRRVACVCVCGVINNLTIIPQESVMPRPQ